LFDLQKGYENLKYLIIDEISMVGQCLLGMLDSRLRQIFAGSSDVVFGGISVLMFGDFGQLPPVMDKCLYLPTTCKNVLGTQGRMAYQQVQHAFFLDTVIRQGSDIVFRDLLLRLRDGDISSADWKLLCTRDNVNAIVLEPGFADCSYLFPTRAAVFQHNYCQLRKGENAIAVINAEHPLKDKTSKIATSDDAGGLEAQIALRLDAKVMLIHNLWVACGLVNGAMGVVKGIVYDVDKKPPQLPLVVLVYFPSYTGPTMVGNVVPILPKTFHWKSKRHNCARTQIPLTLCWATTIHKAQGLTLPKAVIHLGNKEMSSGLSFVALSRVKCLHDLCLYPVNFDRLLSITKCSTLHIRRKEEIRLRSLNSV
jgi:ATP-dependent DNA helicase PIF1